MVFEAACVAGALLINQTAFNPNNIVEITHHDYSTLLRDDHLTVVVGQGNALVSHDFSLEGIEDKDGAFHFVIEAWSQCRDYSGYGS